MSTRTAQSLSQYAKECVIEELQYYFADISLFGAPGNPVKAPVIREVYSTDIRTFPIVFIKILNEKTQTLGLNKGFVGDIKSDNQLVGQEFLPGTEAYTNPVPYKPYVQAERYGYMSDVTMSLQIWSDTVDSKNHIADETI